MALSISVNKLILGGFQGTLRMLKRGFPSGREVKWAEAPLTTCPPSSLAPFSNPLLLFADLKYESH